LHKHVKFHAKKQRRNVILKYGEQRGQFVEDTKEKQPLVEMIGIVKRFPGVVANDEVNFTLMPGEVHALLGENGAGKTTLMNILYGLYRPDRGTIKIMGRPVTINSPSKAIKLGIGMVHQNFRLIPTHTVAENVILNAPNVGFFIDWQKIHEELRQQIAKYGWRISPESRVWQLSAGEKQQVEILKLLYRGSRILIFDEPTSVLTPQESKMLFTTMRKMAEEGKGVVLITHKLDEALSVSDRITVMRKGRVALVKPTSMTNRDELALAMIGRQEGASLQPQPGPRTDRPVLSVINLFVEGDKEELAVKGASLDVHRGEILGIAGVSGNGQVELAEAIARVRKIKSGRILLDGEDATSFTPRQMYENGVAYIPPEGARTGVVSELTVLENAILKSYRYSPISNKLLIRWKEAAKLAGMLIERYQVVAPSINAKVKTLSGGNIQRLVLARELLGNMLIKPKLIIAVYPTSGLDIGAAEYVRANLTSMRNEGAGILLISEDLDELLRMSDRIAVMYEGRVVGIFDGYRASKEEIGMLMARGVG
jgi:simple sugar transport system ATP-binding protein